MHEVYFEHKCLRFGWLTGSGGFFINFDGILTSVSGGGTGATATAIFSYLKEVLYSWIIISWKQTVNRQKLSSIVSR